MTMNTPTAEPQRTDIATATLSGDECAVRLLELLKSKQDAAAAALAVEAVTHYPMHTGVLMQAEAAMFRIGLKKEAGVIAAFAVKNDVANADLMAAHATNLWHARDGKQAEALYKKAIESEPDNARAHFRYACMLRDQGRHAEAVREAKQATTHGPNVGLHWSLRGDLCRDAGDEVSANIHRSHANRLRRENCQKPRQYG